MTAIQWAKTVRCDFPGCQSEGEVQLDPEWPDRTLPEGWISLHEGAVTLDIRERYVSELCSIHARTPIGVFMRALKEASDGDGG